MIRPRVRAPATEPTHARSGYSLVEMLAVLTLIAILVAMAGPRLATAGYRNGATMGALGSTMLSAQRAAVARQHRVIVAVDVNAQTLRVHYDRNGDGAVNAGELVRVEPLPTGTVFGRGSAPAYRIGNGAVSFNGRQGTLPAITFQRNGSASEEGGFYITSARDARSGGYARDARMLVVERATGRVSWSAYDGSQWKQSF